MKFLVLSDGEWFTTVVAFYVSLSRFAFETVARFWALFAYFSLVESDGCHFDIWISGGTDVWVDEFWCFLRFPRFVVTIWSSSTSASASAVYILKWVNSWQRRPFCFHKPIIVWSWVAQFWFCFRLVTTQDDRLDISGSKPKYIGLLILISSFLIRIVSEVVIDDGWKGSISGGRRQLFSTNDALSFFLIDKQSEARSTESMVAGLSNDRIDHYIWAVRTSNLLYDWRNEFLSFLFVLIFLGRFDEPQSKTNCFVLVDSADG